MCVHQHFHFKIKKKKKYNRKFCALHPNEYRRLTHTFVRSHQTLTYTRTQTAAARHTCTNVLVHVCNFCSLSAPLFLLTFHLFVSRSVVFLFLRFFFFIFDFFFIFRRFGLVRLPSLFASVYFFYFRGFGISLLRRIFFFRAFVRSFVRSSLDSASYSFVLRSVSASCHLTELYACENG